MKLSDFTFLTDENIDPEVILFLRSNGFEVFDIKESGLQASSDKDIIDLAYNGRMVILTQDYDFCKLVFVKNPDFIGVIHLKPGSFFAGFHIATIKALIEKDIHVDVPFFISVENKNNNIQMRIRNAIHLN